MRNLISCVYYYNYYLQKKMDPEPHLATILFLGACNAVFVTFVIIDALWVLFFCSLAGIWINLPIAIVVLGLTIYYFSNLGNAKRIVKKQPKLFKTRLADKAFVLFFTLFLIGSIFWGPLISDFLLRNC